MVVYLSDSGFLTLFFIPIAAFPFFWGYLSPTLKPTVLPVVLIHTRNPSVQAEDQEFKVSLIYTGMFKGSLGSVRS